MGFSDHTKPVGHCTICNAPVYLVKNQIRRICNCGTAMIGNISYTANTITALLQAGTLTDLTFPPIAPQRSTVPLSFSSPDAMDKPDEDHSHPSQCDSKALLADEEITPERVRRLYGTICLAIRIHRSECSDCAMLAAQNLTCPTHIAMEDGRLFWSKRLPQGEQCSA